MLNVFIVFLMSLSSHRPSQKYIILLVIKVNPLETWRWGTRCNIICAPFPTIINPFIIG